MGRTVALTHPTTGAQVTVDPHSTRARRMRLAGWTETPPSVEDPAASAAPPPAPPEPDLDLNTVDLSEED